MAQLWFSDDEKTVRTEVSDELENYALSGGIFGSRETARRNGTVLYESKNKFVKQLVFPSYEVMKTSCPWLKTPILLPAAWLVRYKRALTASRGNIGYHIERAKTFDRVEDQEQKERCQFLKMRFRRRSEILINTNEILDTVITGLLKERYEK